MPLPQIGLLPEAIAEARAAFEWYRARSESAADAFLSELDQAIAAIAESPETWPRFGHGTRRYLFRRFPFYLVYRRERQHIQVIAVAHGRRRPGYWKGR